MAQTLKQCTLILCVCMIGLAGCLPADDAESRETPTITEIEFDSTQSLNVTNTQGAMPTQAQSVATMQPPRTSAPQVTSTNDQGGVEAPSDEELTQMALETDSPIQTALAIESTVTALADFQAASVVDTNIPNVIGNASLYPFYDDQVDYPSTTLVELQMILDEWFITPTPMGEVTIIAANVDVTRPAINQNPETASTPRPARAEEALGNIPEYVIAELQCAPSSFTGCEALESRSVLLRGINRWQWRLQPVYGVSGRQDLTLMIYSANADGDKLSNTAIWQYNFAISIGEPTLSDILVDNFTTLVGAGVVIIVTIIAGFFAMRQRQTVPVPTNLTGKQIHVFISYRRRNSWGVAVMVKEILTDLGADVFLDVDDIHAGGFETYIKEGILKCDYFVAVLAPDTLESEWVLKEIEFAQANSKTIIPLLVDDFDLYGSDLPPSIVALQKENAINFVPEFYKAGIEKMAIFMGLKQQEA